MIGYLEGKLRHKSPDYIILDVHGVGYIVQVPLSTFYELTETGGTAALHIHTHIREDTLQLFGFKTTAEKEMFQYLITVNGVGPKLAVSILSGLSPDELRLALMQQDTRRLRSIPGVGKKTAERVLLELRDKVKGQKERADEPLLAASGSDAYSDAHSALVNLGYRAAEAERALGKAQILLGENPTLESLLKEALRFLAQPL